jgi:hypothetical protein
MPLLDSVDLRNERGQARVGVAPDAARIDTHRAVEAPQGFGAGWRRHRRTRFRSVRPTASARSRRSRRAGSRLPGEQFKQRDLVARAFADLYRSQADQFPPECRSADYEKRLQAAYPIHPEIFDRLYTDWSTLVKFQRTRGVLRLMAAVIHSCCPIRTSSKRPSQLTLGEGRNAGKNCWSM